MGKKASKEEMGQGSNEGDGSVGTKQQAPGGGRRMSWIGKRKSKDLMGYKGDGFKGAVENVDDGEGGTGGGEREREASSGVSGVGAGSMGTREEEEVVMLGARIGLMGAGRDTGSVVDAFLLVWKRERGRRRS